MRLIKLGKKPLFAKISDRDYKKVRKRKWHAVRIRAYSNGKKYCYGFKAGSASGRNRKIWMHNYIMHPTPGLEVDHIDGDNLNNMRSNLRLVPHWINCMNKKKRPGTSSKFIGVTKAKAKKKFESMYWEKKTRKHIFIGYFTNEIDAAKAHDKVVRKLYGRYARVNFKPA
jgi:hypothetical protein